MQLTRPIETDERGRLLLTIYGQDGKLQTMPVADTPSNRHLIAWLRQHDRYSPSPMGAGG